MRLFHLTFLLGVLACFSVANAQSGADTGKAVGDTLFNKYKNQLERSKPQATQRNSRTLKKPTQTPTTTSRSAKPETSPKPATDIEAPAPSAKKSPRTMSRKEKEKWAAAVRQSIEGRVKNLSNSDVSTKDLKDLVSYMEAINAMLKLDGKPVRRADASALLKKLDGIQVSKMAANIKSMSKTGRELNVLQQVRRKVGSDTLAAAIDDSKSGGMKMKRAVKHVRSQLQNQAKTKADRSRVGRVTDMLERHVSKDIPKKVMAATLAPLTMKGAPVMSGKHFAKLLEVSDDEDEEGLQIQPGTPIIKSGAEVANR